MGFWDYGWRPYVPVWKRRQQAAREAQRLAKKGHKTEPVVVEGRQIAQTFWGKSWCENLERYSDFENRLPRGRTYVRNGSVIDLKLEKGAVRALVSGSSIYKVKVEFGALAKARWKSLRAACAGQIDSLVELLEGRLSDGVMELITARESGLFPAPKEIKMSCSCPDWAEMCKHVAAVLYGVGARLDTQPELLFLLRDVNQLELVSDAAAGVRRIGASDSGTAEMDTAKLSKLFGIEIDSGAASTIDAGLGRRPRAAAGRRSPARSRAQRAVRAPAPAPVMTAAALPQPVDPALTRRLKRLRRHFVRTETLTTFEFMQLFDLDRPAALKDLKALVAAGTIEPRGQKRTAHYVAGVGLS